MAILENMTNLQAAIVVKELMPVFLLLDNEEVTPDRRTVVMLVLNILAVFYSAEDNGDADLLHSKNFKEYSMASSSDLVMKIIPLFDEYKAEVDRRAKEDLKRN